METPLAKAAKRAGAFIAVPITVALAPENPRLCTYCRTIGPMTDADPASDSPNPSRIDFLPSANTSSGISAYFELTMNSHTYLVSPGAFGNSPAGLGEAATSPPPTANADNAREFLKKSRRIMGAHLQNGHYLSKSQQRAENHLHPKWIVSRFPVGQILKVTSFLCWPVLRQSLRQIHAPRFPIRI